MGAIERAKILADIAEIGARIYGIIRDKSKASADKDAKIKELEAQLAELKKKVQ
jgi:hypothetical protein